MITPIELLQHYQKGERLRHEDVNGLIDAAKLAKGNLGFNDGNVDVTRYKPSSKSERVLHYKNSTGATMPAYSVFCPSGTPSAFSDPPLGDMDKFGVTAPGSPFVYLTNDSISIPDTRNAEVRIIPFDEPTLLRVNAAAIPGIWEPCGVELETNQLTAGALGFVCLSASTVVDGTTYIWVARTREPIRIACVTYGAVTAYNPLTKVLGTGYALVLYRNPATANSLDFAKTPQTKIAPFICQVWNKGSALLTDTLISVTDTLGVGLLIDSQSTQNLLGVPFNNNYGGVIPAWAVMRPDATFDADSRVNVNIANSTFHRRYLINGAYDIPYPGTGFGTWLETENPLSGFGRVLYDTTHTPGLNEEWGAKTGEWKLFRNRPGFFAVGNNNGSSARFIQREVTELIGKASGTIAANGGTGTVNIWVGLSGSEALSEYSITVRNLTSVAINNTKYASLGFRNGNWYAAAMQCP